MTIINPQIALSRLMDGNQAYCHASSNPGNISEDIRTQTHIQGQHPYAIILTCSDSRVIPEHIFMAGIGELFTIRVAGNVVDDCVLGSIEYAAAHLDAKLIVVLGHSGCGAVDAAIHDAGHDRIISITQKIKNAIGHANDAVVCEKTNVYHSIESIRNSTLIQHLEASGALNIVGAYYHTDSGVVEWLS